MATRLAIERDHRLRQRQPTMKTRGAASRPTSTGPSSTSNATLTTSGPDEPPTAPAARRRDCLQKFFRLERNSWKRANRQRGKIGQHRGLNCLKEEQRHAGHDDAFEIFLDFGLLALVFQDVGRDNRGFMRLIENTSPPGGEGRGQLVQAREGRLVGVASACDAMSITANAGACRWRARTNAESTRDRQALK